MVWHAALDAWKGGQQHCHAFAREARQAPLLAQAISPSTQPAAVATSVPGCCLQAARPTGTAAKAACMRTQSAAAAPGAVAHLLRGCKPGGVPQQAHRPHAGKRAEPQRRSVARSAPETAAAAARAKRRAARGRGLAAVAGGAAGRRGGAVGVAAGAGGGRAHDVVAYRIRVLHTLGRPGGEGGVARGRRLSGRGSFKVLGRRGRGALGYGTRSRASCSVLLPRGESWPVPQGPCSSC